MSGRRCFTLEPGGLAGPCLGALALAFLVLAAACHPLNNPVDPRSSAYTGEPVVRDPQTPHDAPELLPDTVLWESVAEHLPGQRLALEITSDGTFVEPRRPDSPQQLWIVVTFEEAVDPYELERGMVLARITNGFATETRVIYPWMYSLTPDSLRLIVAISSPWPPFTTLPTAAMIRLRIIDANGHVAGERLFGILPGDFDGDGTVTFANDIQTGAADYNGFLASRDDPGTIRADMNADGLVEVDAGDPDYTIVSQNTGTTLPDPPSEF